MATHILTQEEFEYQAMCGSTADAFVYGLGHVQWGAGMALAGGPSLMGNPYGATNWYDAAYFSPKATMDISPDSDAYLQALSQDIKEIITDGKSIWNPIDGTVRRLSSNAVINVKVDHNEQVTINIREGTARSETISTSFESLVNACHNPHTHLDTSGSLSLPHPELGGTTGSSIDLGAYSKAARKWSSRTFSAQAPFLRAINELNTYSKTISPGGTKLVSPISKRLPKFFPKSMAGQLFKPVGGITMSNSTILACSKWLGILGYGIGAFGIAVGGLDAWNNGLNWSNGLHITMAILSFNSYTAPIAAVYFVADAAFLIFTDKGLGDRIDDHMRGRPASEQVQIVLGWTGGPICAAIDIYLNLTKD